jgi:hypothetical protein
VWFDSLDKPWPKHRCFADAPVAVKLRSRLAEREMAQRAVFVGVVVETVITHPGSGGKVVIEYGDGQQFEVAVLASADLTELPGALVIVALDDSGFPRLYWGPELLQRAMGLSKYVPVALA